VQDPRCRKIAEMIEPSLMAMGFELVRVHLSGEQRQVLQIMAEPADGSEMTVEHCAEISETVSAILDVNDPIKGTYRLEVSSPGIDRPLTRAKDFARFAGFEARVELAAPIDGRRRFTGVLRGASETPSGTLIEINTDKGPFALPFDEIQKAKLVLTDALIDATRQGAV